MARVMMASLAAILISAVAVAKESNDQQIRNRVAEFEAAWNKHDPQAMAAVWSVEPLSTTMTSSTNEGTSRRTFWIPCSSLRHGMTTVRRKFLYIFSGVHFGTGRYTCLVPREGHQAERTSGREIHPAGALKPLRLLDPAAVSVAALTH